MRARRPVVWVVAAVVALALALCYWQRSAAREGEAGPLGAVQAAGWRALEGGGEPEKYVTWEGFTLRPSEKQRKRMATCKAPITTGTVSGAFTFQASWKDSDENGFHSFAFGALVMEYQYSADGYRYYMSTDPLNPEFGYWLYMRLPIGGDGNLHTGGYSLTFGGATRYLTMTPGSVPIGEKGPTCSKEQTMTEAWADAEGAVTTFTLTAAGEGELGKFVSGSWVPISSAVGTLAGNVVNANFTLAIDGDDWGSLGADGATISNISWGGETVDCSSLTERNVSGSTTLWVEGSDSGVIRFWGTGSDLTNYREWGGDVNAPYSLDFSPYNCLWLSGADAATDVTVVCPALRLLDSEGQDAGPWTGTFQALKDRGRIKQTSGFCSWDTRDPDVLPVVELYATYASLRACGALDHGAPELKVEGCVYGVTWSEENEALTTSPADGDYWDAGSSRYTNGSFWLWSDDAGETWELGPDPEVPSYYTCDDGGPQGIYMFNEASGYIDTVDEETGIGTFTLAGLGPVCSEQTAPADPDTSTPSFAHDATFVFDTHGVDATNRTSDPYMTDIFTLRHADYEQVGNVWQPTGEGIGIYGDACAHTDWVATGCTVPDAGGNFTVSVAGATLELTLPSNYIERQAHTYVDLPNRYWIRNHDGCLGQGDETFTEVAEAIYDWRGWGYLKCALVLPETLTESPYTTVTATVTYYMDLGGVSDNHKTGAARNAGYSYTPGDLYTYTQERELVWRDETTREAWWLVDLALAGRPLALATKLTLTFADTGAYQLKEPALISDLGDRQEVTTTAPYWRQVETVTAGSVTSEVHSAGLKFFESYAYAQGGLSTAYDGVYDRALFIPDDAKPNRVEKCFPTLNVVIGATSGLDQTAVMTLAGWPINTSCDAWSYTYSASAEAAHMQDSDGNTLRALNCGDICPCVRNSQPQVAVRVFRVTCAPGLPRTFYGTHYLGGKVHGLATTGTVDEVAFPRKRTYTPNTAQATLGRRTIGSGGAYTVVDSDVRPDSQGYYGAPRDFTDPYTDGPKGMPTVPEEQVLYEYAVKPNGGTFGTVGQFYTREYVAEDIVVVTPVHPYMLRGCHNRLYLVCAKDGTVHLCHLPYGMSWDDADTTFGATGLTEWPCLTYMMPCAMGGLLTGDTAQEYRRWCGDHNVWRDPVDISALNYSYPYSAWGLTDAYVYVAGYSGGTHKLACLRATTGEVQWQRDIGAGDDAPGALGMCRGRQVIVYAMPSGSDLHLYWSRSDGDTWTNGATVTGLSYPSIDCSSISRFYLAGYADGKAYCERWDYPPTLTRRVTGRVEIGASDEDRVCLTYIPSVCRPVVVVSDGGTLKAYRSKDDADTWTLAETVLA